MWHFKTKLGTFWIVEPQTAGSSSCYLGLDDDTIAPYGDIEEAIEAVCSHSTGEIRWDTDTRIKIPHDITQWLEGEPETWHKSH